MYCLLLMIIVGNLFRYSMSLPAAHKVCESDNGYMTLSEETQILSTFKNNYGIDTILIEPDPKKMVAFDEEFTFTCHKYDKNDTKIIFGDDTNSTKNTLKGKESPISRTVINYNLKINDLDNFSHVLGSIAHWTQNLPFLCSLKTSILS